MTELQFEAEIALGEVVPHDVVRERVYGNVRVTAEWPAQIGLPETRVALQVRGEIEPRDAPAYVELFFHDVFLLLNLASPASFGGTISLSGGEFRVRELSFDPRVFSYAAPLQTLPLTDVAAWYDGLDLGTKQVAKRGAATALVQLLHLARSPECETDSILRLAIAAEAVLPQPPARLLELREEIARGRVPSIHPMHDDALDARVEDATREWIEVADHAARLVIGALQDSIARNS